MREHSMFEQRKLSDLSLACEFSIMAHWLFSPSFLYYRVAHHDG